ncbi:MAG: lipid A deacylase LpxR family protein [Gammaproteobacteria bacterium]|nr:lipid A deacylase LpxR family protein [Gammaproteobacteria bacterium]
MNGFYIAAAAVKVQRLFGRAGRESLPLFSGLVNRTLLVLALSSGCIAPALAQTLNAGGVGSAHCAAEDSLRFRGGTARLENDLLTGTDQNYTSGIGFTLISQDIAGRPRPECLPLPIRLQAQLIESINPSFLADADNPGATHNMVAKFGQAMYTPRDHSRTDLVTDDRPYAGLLYVGLAWNRRLPLQQSNQEMLDTREITLGVIGPWSLAEQSQNLVHDAIGSDRFLGWEHQLDNEPAVQMTMDRKLKTYRGTGDIIPGLSGDLIRSLGLRLGNIETSATLGVEGRIGWNLPNDFGSYPIRTGAENSPPSAASLHSGPDDAIPHRSRPRPGVHLFGILEAKAVAWDFSLDGNLFSSSHSVSRKPWVAQAAVGLSTQGLVGGRGYRLAVMQVYRTREFAEQTTNQAYGSITLSVEF